MFSRARTFDSTNYKIDFLNEDIVIEPMKGFFRRLIDFICSIFLIHLTVIITLPLTIICIVLVKLSIITTGSMFLKVYIISNVIGAIILTIFGLCYISSDKKIWKDIQMFLEIFSHRPLFWKRKLNLKLESHQKIILSSKFFIWKYEMLFYGKSKNDIKSITYQKKKRYLIRRDKERIIIEFTQPTTGRLEMIYWGNIRSIIEFKKIG